MGDAEVPTNQMGQLRRPARALIGWMNPNQARLWLAGWRQDLAGNEEHVRKVERANTTVAARVAGLNQTNAVNPAPPELAAHVEALRTDPSGALYFNEGWEVATTDLSRICAIQPHVFTDQAAQRVAGIEGDNILALAAASLPITP